MMNRQLRYAWLEADASSKAAQLRVMCDGGTSYYLLHITDLINNDTMNLLHSASSLCEYKLVKVNSIRARLNPTFAPLLCPSQICEDGEFEARAPVEFGLVTARYIGCCNASLQVRQDTVYFVGSSSSRLS